MIVLITGEGHLHGFSHTYVGASLLGVAAALSGKYLSELGLVIIGIAKKDNPIKIAWWVVFVSALIGTFSHVILDSIMHGDVEPFNPFSRSNDLLGIISISHLYKLCLYSGIVGTGLYYMAQFLTKKHNC